MKAAAPLIVVAALLGAGIAPAQQTAAELKTALASSRSKTPPFCAEYRLTITVPGAKPSGSDGEDSQFGRGDSETKIKAAVDNRASDLILAYDKPGTAEYDRYFVEGNQSTNVVDGGRAASTQKGSMGMTNPASFGFESHAELATRLESNALTPNGPLTFVASSKDSQDTYRFALHNGSVLLEEYVCHDPNSNVDLTIKVLEWQTFRGFDFPKRISFEAKQAGSVIQTRSYELVKVLEKECVPLKLSFANGAVLKDAQSQDVYIARGGQMVAEPILSPKRTPWEVARRYVILGAASALALWCTLFIRRRSQQTPPKS